MSDWGNRHALFHAITFSIASFPSAQKQCPMWIQNFGIFDSNSLQQRQTLKPDSCSWIQQRRRPGARPERRYTTAATVIAAAGGAHRACPTASTSTSTMTPSPRGAAAAPGGRHCCRGFLLFPRWLDEVVEGVDHSGKIWF